MTEDVAFTVRIPPRVADALRAYVEDQTGMTIGEVCQLTLFLLYEGAAKSSTIPDDGRSRVINALESMLISQGDEVRKMLLSFRRVTGNGHLKKSEGAIQSVITLLDGGVVETFDLTADWGDQYTISRDKAFELLANADPTIAPLLKRVMQSQSTTSVASTLRRILEDECKYLDHEAQAEGYAQNTYGIVPKRTNKNELPREEI